MTPQLDKIRAEAEFDAEIYPLYDGKQKDLSSGRRIGARDENARLNAIIEKLIRVIERQDAALGFYGTWQNFTHCSLEGEPECADPEYPNWMSGEGEYDIEDGSVARTAQAEARAILSGEGE